MTQFNEEANTAKVEAAFRGHPDTWTAKDVLVAEVKRLRGIAGEMVALRTRLSEFKSHKCFGFCGACRENLEQMEMYRTRLSEAEAENARLKAEAAINADSCVKNANGWDGERCKVAAIRGRLVELVEVIAAVPGVFPVLNPLMDLVRSTAPYECEEKRKREEAERNLKDLSAPAILAIIGKAEGAMNLCRAWLSKGEPLDAVANFHYNNLAIASGALNRLGRILPSQEKPSDKEKPE